MAVADTHLPSRRPSLQILLQAGQWIQGFWSFGFPTNAKAPSSKAPRQASAQCTPTWGRLKEVLSEKHMNFTFCVVAQGPAIGSRTYLVSSHLPPAHCYASLPCQDYRLAQLLTLQTTDHKFPARLPRKENQVRTQILVCALRSLPLLILLQKGFSPTWFALILMLASSCQCTSTNKLSPKVLCLSALFIFKYVKFFWQDSHLGFPFLTPYLLAALSPYSSQTQINHILIWNSLCSVTRPNLNACRGKELFHIIIIENLLPVKFCYFHKDRDCLDPGSEVRFRSWGEWWAVIITLWGFAAFLIQRSEPCLQYITTAGYVILCKLLPKFHNSWNKQESLNLCALLLWRLKNSNTALLCFYINKP